MASHNQPSATVPAETKSGDSNKPRPDEPPHSTDVWYRGWECGFDATAAYWGAEPWRAYRGGCDLGARQASGRSWSHLLDEIDDEEDPAELLEVVRCARALLAKLDECSPHIDGAFAFQAMHGGNYSGPQYGEIAEALRSALEALDRRN